MVIIIVSKLNCRFIFYFDLEIKFRNWEEKIIKCMLFVENLNYG